MSCVASLPSLFTETGVCWFCNAVHIPGRQGFPEEMRLGSAITDDGEEPRHGQMGERACEVSEGVGMAMRLDVVVLGDPQEWGLRALRAGPWR